MRHARGTATTTTSESRFAFGENWQKFLDLVDDERIRAAETSLTDYLPATRLDGLTFLDIGSGSGLFSLGGMDKGRDLVDWVGGYPFEVATPEEVFGFFRARRFVLDRLETCGGGLGCDEFVFTAPPGP